MAQPVANLPEYLPLAKIRVCKYCVDYVPALAKVAGEWVDAAHCANWYRTFPNGCDRWMRAVGSDDDLE